MLRKENSLNKLRDSAKQVNRWQENNQDRLKEIIACKCEENINDDRNGVMLKQKNILITWDGTL